MGKHRGKNGALSSCKGKEKEAPPEVKEPDESISALTRHFPFRSTSPKYSNFHFVLSFASIAVAIFVIIRSLTMLELQNRQAIEFPDHRTDPNYRRSNAPTTGKSFFGGNLSSDNGGWNVPIRADWELLSTERCDIVRKPIGKMNAKKFEREYRGKKPIILQFPTGADGWTKSEVWTLPYLLSTFGQWDDALIQQADSSDQQTSRYPEKHKFKDYLQNIANQEHHSLKEPPFVFDQEFCKIAISNSTVPPDYLNKSSGFFYNTVVVGASMTGHYFEQQPSDAWSGLVFGWRRWLFYPSTQTPLTVDWTTPTVMDWLTQIYPRLWTEDRPMDCLQNPGEILYIPESWYHAFLSVGHSISIESQKFNDFVQANITNHVESHVENEAQGEHVRLEDEIFLDKELDDKAKVDLTLPVLLELNATYPSRAEFANRLGELFAARGDFRSSLKATRQAVQLDPMLLVAHLNLGKLYFAIENSQAAEEHFKIAALLDEKSAGVCWLYGEFLAFQKRSEEAIGWFKKGAQYHADKKEFFENLVQKTEAI